MRSNGDTLAFEHRPRLAETPRDVRVGVEHLFAGKLERVDGR